MDYEKIHKAIMRKHSKAQLAREVLIYRLALKISPAINEVVKLNKTILKQNVTQTKKKL